MTLLSLADQGFHKLIRIIKEIKVRMRQRFIAVLAVLAFFALSGCTTARLTHFNTFAQAGTMYVTASQTVIQNAGTAAINTDSALLTKERPDLDQQKRQNTVNQSNARLKERLQILQLISTHGQLLQEYFQALASLSDTKAKDSVGTAAQNVFNSLAKISPTLENAKVGAKSVSSLIPAITDPIVATFKVHALNEELKTRSKAITKELALQEAAFNLIKEELKTDTQEQQNLNETESIQQYAASAPLPADWANRRLILLSTPPSVASADAASKAAAKLRTTFAALVENRFDSGDFASLMTDISNMLTIAQGIEGSKK